MGIIAGTRAEKTYTGEYDFAVDGGAVGTIPLRSNDGPIPIGSQIMSGILEIVTPFTTGASGQGAVTVESAGDIQAAAVVSGAPYSTSGNKSIVPAGTGATAIKTTADRSPSFVISVGALTAGKLRLHLLYK